MNNRRFYPLLLTLIVIALDQLSKLWIVNHIEVGSLYRYYFGDFLAIIHVRNTGAAFSLAAKTTGFLHTLVLIIIPFLFMIFLMFIITSKKNGFSVYQAFLLAGIAGGGIGNLIDRIFRSSTGGVVDFISVKFYGLFGMDRFPTFNLADSSVVVCTILLILSFIFSKRNSN